MSLSVCLITADPPSRVAAILEPLRAHASEIIIAADTRVEEPTLARYEALADRLFRIEYLYLERHLAWLFAQCSGDWIMKLDGDEVPSGAFLRRLPHMLSSRHIRQFWTPNAWLFPDRNRILGDLPWSMDYVNRLMRNDGSLRVRGLQHLHADPVTPREYLEEPFYHLDLLLSSQRQRRDKALRYEAIRPGLTALGGGRINEAFYLPELRHELDLGEVPEQDRAALARALVADEIPDRSLDVSASLSSVPVVPLAETDRLWEGRTVKADAYHATIEAPAGRLALAPAEQASLVLRVSNAGSERWPANLDEHPRIRLAYRWLDLEGAIHTDEGQRSPFPRQVEPGESILAPLQVHAPTHAGDYLLEVDIVHEHARWFGCETRLPVRVGPLPDLAKPGLQLRETPHAGRRWRRMLIPRTIHRVWLGETPMPSAHERFGESFAANHPRWRMRLWRDADLASLGISDSDRRRARSASELSNLVRYEVLHRFGGIYVDTDVESLRPLAPLLRGVEAFAALEAPGRAGTAILGAVPRHPTFGRAARLTRQTLGVGPHSADANGPRLLSLILEQDSGVSIFGAQHFYPYRWDELEQREESFPDAYAIHHWTLSWQDESPG
jgi:Glycosyltransferase sugar-binding region containing DXD motif